MGSFNILEDIKFKLKLLNILSKRLAVIAQNIMRWTKDNGIFQFKLEDGKEGKMRH